MEADGLTTITMPHDPRSILQCPHGTLLPMGAESICRQCRVKWVRNTPDDPEITASVEDYIAAAITTLYTLGYVWEGGPLWVKRSISKKSDTR